MNWSNQVLEGNRPQTTVKNARYMISVSQCKLPYFEGIFKLWTHEQQELFFLQNFISFAYQNLAVITDFVFPWNFVVVWGLFSENQLILSNSEWLTNSVSKTFEWKCDIYEEFWNFRAIKNFGTLLALKVQPSFDQSFKR